jgi:hypothetical protein
VRFPRILRWRHDKTSSQADSLDTLKRLAEPPQATPPAWPIGIRTPRRAPDNASGPAADHPASRHRCGPA